MALTDKLTSIADAIREKGGTTEKLTLDAMPTAIANLPTGGGGGEDNVPNPLVYTGDCEYAFGNNKYNWLIENYGDRIQVKCQEGTYLFAYSDELETIPFDITSSGSSNAETRSMFLDCKKLKSIGKITMTLNHAGSMFSGCHNLRHLPEIIIEGTTSMNSNGLGGMFYQCYSLREIPENLLKKLVNPNSSNTNGQVYNGLCYLSTIDEITGIPVNDGKEITSDVMSSMFKYCYRLKRATFATGYQGAPITAKWKNQTIKFNVYTGWAGYSTAHKEILNYNSGITAEDENNGIDTNPNYWSRYFGNSRFGHAAAVEFINSLPDTSAYLATSGGTNSIKFYSNAGSNAYGDSVNALTEEEIAVAAAKGWTIGYTTNTY